MTSETMEFRLVPVSLIDPSPIQPRRTFDSRALDELTTSVRKHGVLQPVRVREVEGRFELIVGERRWAAAKAAGLGHIPALIVRADVEEASVEALVENIQREDLNAVDRANALKRLRATLGLHSWEEVGNSIGISRTHVHRLLNVTRLPTSMQNDVRGAGLTEKHARAINTLRSHPDLQFRLWDRIHAENLSGEDALATAKELRSARQPGPGASQPKPVDNRSDLRALADQFLTALLSATPAEVSGTLPELNDLRRWLTQVLDGERQLRGGPLEAS